MKDNKVPSYLAIVGAFMLACLVFGPVTSMITGVLALSVFAFLGTLGQKQWGGGFVCASVIALCLLALNVLPAGAMGVTPEPPHGSLWPSIAMVSLCLALCGVLYAVYNKPEILEFAAKLLVFIFAALVVAALFLALFATPAGAMGLAQESAQDNSNGSSAVVGAVSLAVTFVSSMVVLACANELSSREHGRYDSKEKSRPLALCAVFVLGALVSTIMQVAFGLFYCAAVTAAISVLAMARLFLSVTKRDGIVGFILSTAENIGQEMFYSAVLVAIVSLLLALIAILVPQPVGAMEPTPDLPYFLEVGDGKMSWYAQGVMDRVIRVRQTPGRTSQELPTPLPDVSGYIAMAECEDVGNIVWVCFDHQVSCEKFLVTDCASKTDRQSETDQRSGWLWMKTSGIAGEADFESIIRNRASRGMNDVAIYKEIAEPRWR